MIPKWRPVVWHVLASSDMNLMVAVLLCVIVHIVLGHLCPPVLRVSLLRLRSSTVLLPPLLDHRRRHILGITDWRIAPCSAPCATLSTSRAVGGVVVRAWAIAGIRGDRLFDDLLYDLLVCRGGH